MKPFNLGVYAGFFLDLFNGFLTLFFLAVDHDDAGFVEDEGTGNLVAFNEISIAVNE